MSGQLDKAVERFKLIVQLQPANLKARLLLADTYEKMQKNEEAIKSYRELLPYINNAEMKAEVEKRVAQLKAK
jgi:tetratricopeptide (TPR) repeat protein